MIRRVGLLLMAVLVIAGCSDASPAPAPSAPTRLVGAHRVAVAIPIGWRTDVEHGSFCAPTDRRTVLFVLPYDGPVGSCAVPAGAAWPAQDSLAVYISAPGSMRAHRTPPTGRLHGMPYFIATSRQAGPGVALTLSVPQAGVVFLVGAADRRAAEALLWTVRFVAPGTPYEKPPRADEADHSAEDTAAAAARVHGMENGYVR